MEDQIVKLAKKGLTPSQIGNASLVYCLNAYIIRPAKAKTDIFKKLISKDFTPSHVTGKLLLDSVEVIV